MTARHELEMRDMDRRLREEQDLEFQESFDFLSIFYNFSQTVRIFYRIACVHIHSGEGEVSVFALHSTLTNLFLFP